MAQIRSYDKPFEVVDLTEELNLIPNTWGLIGELGIFSPEPVTQHTVIVESVAGTLSVIPDRVRGDKNNVNKDDNRVIYSFPIPHFPLDDQLTPQDLQGKRAYGADTADTTAEAIARKLVRIRRNHSITMEAARAYAITVGGIYAPSGTVSENYYTTFGITRTTVDFVFGTATTDIIGKVEAAIAAIQDNIQSGEVVNEVKVLCSPTFFNSLINHPKVVDAYKFYTSTQQPQRDRLGTGLYRTFYHAGATFIEYRGSYNGTALIPAGDAYAIPMGTMDVFKSYFSPANKMALVNTLGQEAYVFQYNSPMDEGILLQSESNHLHLVRRPGAIIRLFSSN